jgi:tetraacyldisaccharide 4'-kinase
MNPLTGLYGAGAALRNVLFDRGILRARQLEQPVISVGNLSAGGSGKTPLVIALGELLKERGIRFDVLSRGYGRKTRGESRYQAGRVAEQEFHAQMHVLDDGFQHRSLARDFDIVLVTPGDFEDRLLPFGRLREPLGSLRRADAIVLPQGFAAEHSDLREKTIWRMQREMHISRFDFASSIRQGTAPDATSPPGTASEDTAREGTASAVPAVLLQSAGFSPAFPRSPVVFCGLARPQQFFAQVRATGVTPAAEVIFRDHHAYNKSDIERLVAMRDKHGASGFLTTEKDAINLGPLQASLEPLALATLKLTLDRPADLVDTILARIGDRKPRS